MRIDQHTKTFCKVNNCLYVLYPKIDLNVSLCHVNYNVFSFDVIIANKRWNSTFIEDTRVESEPTDDNTDKISSSNNISVAIGNVAQPMFNLLKESIWNLLKVFLFWFMHYELSRDLIEGWNIFINAKRIKYYFSLLPL